MPMSTAHATRLFTYIVDTYRGTYPDEHARIARAVELVQQGHVTLLPNGTAQVQSQGKRSGGGWSPSYHVNGACECYDSAKAPEGRCKHRFAKTFARKLACLSRKARYALHLDTATGAQVPGIAWPSLDEMQIWYAPDEDTYPTRMWTVTAAQLVLLAHIEA